MDEVRDIDVKERLDSLLDRVERGEEITVTRAGRPVAKLVTVEPRADRAAAEAAAGRILERSGQMSLGEDRIVDLVKEGRP